MTHDRPSVDPLVEGLASPEEAVRRKSLFQLARSLDLGAIPAIQKVAAGDASMEARYLARKLLALYESKKPESRALIRPGSSSDTPAVPASSPDLELGAADPAKRAAALKACAARRDPDLLPAVLERAGYDEKKDPIESVPEVRSLIPLVLIQLGGKSQAAAVAAFLEDKDSRVRANTLAALKTIGDQTSWALIVKCFQDPDHRVKTAAIGALSKLGKVNLIKCCRAMIEKAGDQYWQTDSAVALLASSNLPDAVPLLESVLADPIPGVAQKAMKRLERLAASGCEAAKAALETASMLGIGEERPDDFLELEDVSASPGGTSRASDARPRRVSHVQDLELVVHGDDGVLPSLLEQVREEKEVPALVGMLRALGRIGNGVVIPVLKGFLTHEADEVREATIDALAALGTDEALNPVMPALRDRSPVVIARAILALRSHPSLDLGKPIAELAGHTDPAHRRTAVLIITELADPRFVSLLDSLSKDSDERTASGLHPPSGPKYCPASNEAKSTLNRVPKSPHQVQRVITLPGRQGEWSRRPGSQPAHAGIRRERTAHRH